MKKVVKYFVLFAVIVALFTSCASGGGGGTNIPQGGTFTPGDNVDLTTETLDDNGGTINVTNTGTYLDGVKITFPAGALSENMNVTVGYNTGNVNLPEGMSARGDSKTLLLEIEGSNQFSQLVEITVPYTDEDNIPIPFYVDEDNELAPVLVTEIDTENKTFTFVTAHASLWTWLGGLIENLFTNNSKFEPGDDGFQIANYGSLINSGGECFGMSTFSQWYYKKKVNNEGDFYDKFMENVGKDTNNNNITGQDVIATRAHSAANQSWNYSNFILPNINTTDEQRYNQIINAIGTTNDPVNLSLKKVDNNGDFIGGHAVLAFDYNDEGEISIYDPNFPNQTKTIFYNTTNKTFNDYRGYSKFFLNGTGTYSLRENYENILSDAKHDFTSDNHPNITITSHQNGQSVQTRNINLQGVVESSEVLIKQLDVFVGNEKFSTSVDNSGNFSVGISLNTGEQTLRFIAKDQNGNNITPNNFDTNPFSITLDLDQSVMLVTLTWDKDDTDLDLYVIDPTGDYSCYYHKPTADGGELDYDITTGFGPEHWTLTANDTVRWDQNAYRVRVHYYSDHDNGGTNYKLSVKLYEGTNREVEYIKTGYLSSNNSGNDGPNDTGSDWVDFTFPIVLSQNGSQQRHNLKMPEARDILPAAERAEYK